MLRALLVLLALPLLLPQSLCICQAIPLLHDHEEAILDSAPSPRVDAPRHCCHCHHHDDIPASGMISQGDSSNDLKAPADLNSTTLATMLKLATASAYWNSFQPLVMASSATAVPQRITVNFLVPLRTLHCTFRL